MAGIDTGGGGFSGSSAATAGNVGGSSFGSVNIGGGKASTQTMIIAAVALVAVLYVLKRGK